MLAGRQDARFPPSPPPLDTTKPAAVQHIIWFESLGMRDVALAGGKNASLGELYSGLGAAGVRVPRGFATTTAAWREFLSRNRLDEGIEKELAGLDVHDLAALAASGARIRAWIEAADLGPELSGAVARAYSELAEGDPECSVAVRSSATAEDLPEASFAGQQETFLNVRGTARVLATLRRVFASLYTDRAIAYRVHHGHGHTGIALSAGVQRMVRSDLGASGVMFTLDTESGFPDVVLVNATWGLGELLVQGQVTPDEFHVFKPALAAGRPAILRRRLGSKASRTVFSEEGVRVEATAPEARRCFCLTDREIEQLARYALAIEAHYGRPMDVEWGKDGRDGSLSILQARPETVASRSSAHRIERFRLVERSRVLVEGRSIGARIGAGPARLVRDAREMHRIRPGEVLVTRMTDPDWEPIMKRAAAIVTDRGGRTCHAAIVARELGIPAVVGTRSGTRRIATGREVTVSCAEGDTGFVYGGRLDYEVQRFDVESMPEIPVKIAMNVGNPERAFDLARLPGAGVGLARLEFIAGNTIGVHPRALLDYAELPAGLRERIDVRLAGYVDPVRFYVDKLAEGVATIAAAFAPRPVIVRLSDFKSDEYANLLGGDRYEPREGNPMLGFRGASRYRSPEFVACFALECRALRYVRDEMGLVNVEVMVPFVRTLTEAEEVVSLLAGHGLARGRNGLRLVMMCEVPSNAVLAPRFLEYFDGFSIGSNDLTQMTLGLDRNSERVADLFDERDPAVQALLRQTIAACRAAGKYVGICGQGPSDHPELARWLMDEGIDTLSMNPDSVLSTWLYLAGESPP